MTSLKLPVPVYGKDSMKHLTECEPKLQHVAQLGLTYMAKIGRDASIIEGRRSLETQLKLYEHGKSHIDGITKKGKHNYDPSQAFDFVPYLKGIGGITGSDDQIVKIADKFGIELYSAKFKVMGEFALIANCYLMAAHDLGYKVRWGGDWNMNSNTFDNTFNDMGHIELC